MKFKRRKNNQILYIAIAIFALIGLILVEKEIISRKKTKLSENFRAKQEVQANQNSSNSASPIPSPIQLTTASTKTELADLEIPVLMYHHIRDMDDPADKIGTNLSVSPQRFREQLDLVEQKGYSTITFNDLLLENIPQKPIILTFDDGYSNFYENAYPELQKRNMSAVSYIITDSTNKESYMNSEQIKEISTKGIEIGSHTLSHPDLSKASADKAKREIFESKSELEGLIGKKIVSLCYPSGKYSKETESLVKEAGYSFAVTTKGGVTAFNDNFALNRYRVNKDTSIKNYLK